MGRVTHEQANLMLTLYDLRREPRLRQAREWFGGQFQAATPEEMISKYPPGSAENLHIRMTLGYWDMAASIVNRGLIDDEFFFETNGEVWAVWDRIRPVVPAWRAWLKNPTVFANLEALGKRFEAWREKKAPGSTEAMRQVMAQMQKAVAKAAGE